MQKLGIIGFGWLASRFARIYGEKYTISTTTTSREKLLNLQKEGYEATLMNFENDASGISVWEKCPQQDAILITVPLSVRYDSLENVQRKTGNILKFLGDYNKPIILISSTGIYPQERGIYREEFSPAQQVITERGFVEKFSKTTVLRCGGLMGDERFISKYQPIKDLNQTVNHVHYKDVAKVIDMVLTEKITGEVLNVVAPQHPTKKEVLEFERNKKLFRDDEPKVRIVSSEKLISKYAYEFEFPDPLYFKNAN